MIHPSVRTSGGEYEGREGTDRQPARVTSNDLIGQPVRPMTGPRNNRPAQVISKRGEEEMADKGKRDKVRKEEQRKGKLSVKEKRKLKKEKKK